MMRWNECECGQNFGTFKARDGHVPDANRVCYADRERWPCRYVVRDHERREHDHPEP
jgi:hypothetical protein